jgi:hypothetical protein
MTSAPFWTSGNRAGGSEISPPSKIRRRSTLQIKDFTRPRFWQAICNEFLAMAYISTIEGSWRDSESVCALADTDRHLGHLILREHWYAYDGTQWDNASQDFKCLGTFVDLAAAKQIVELAVLRIDGRYIN